MSQAALNPRRPLPAVKPASGNGQSHGARLAGLLFLLAVLVTVIAGGWMVLRWMQDPQRLPISQLVVTGERHYTRDDDIRQAILALGPPGTFMTEDVNGVQQQIENLPWIKQASVRKQWPDELKIHVVEYVPAARWEAHGLLDKDGNVFSVPIDRLSQQVMRLPILSGPQGSEKELLEATQQMATVLSQRQFSLLTVAMSARHAWQLTVSDNTQPQVSATLQPDEPADVKADNATAVVLNLGRSDRMVRLQRFIDLYPVLQQQEQQTGKQISYVDLRYDSGAAVGWDTAANETSPRLPASK